MNYITSEYYVLRDGIRMDVFTHYSILTFCAREGRLGLEGFVAAFLSEMLRAAKGMGRVGGMGEDAGDVYCRGT